MKLTGITIATLVAAGAVLAGGGVAVAGQGQDQGTAANGDRCQRFVARIAERQGVSVAELEAKWKQKAIEGINAALAAGRLTADQATKLKGRIAEWKLCDGSLRKAGTKARQAARLHAAAVASMIAGAIDYVDITRRDLFAEWRAGKSLGEIATSKGKSIPGLKTAMLAKIKARLDKAVTDDKLDGRAARRAPGALREARRPADRKDGHAEALLRRAPAPGADTRNDGARDCGPRPREGTGAEKTFAGDQAGAPPAGTNDPYEPGAMRMPGGGPKPRP